LPSIHAEFIDYGNDTYELVVVKSATHSPRLFNTKWNGTDAYATGDLLVPHPTKDGFWKVFGRADDQIVLSNGEKVSVTL
jgi:non-ribosomal peptide synthetase component F